MDSRTCRGRVCVATVMCAQKVRVTVTGGDGLESITVDKDDEEARMTPMSIVANRNE